MLLVIASVAGCVAEPPVTEVTIGLRNPTAVLAGTSRFDAARFSGQWRTVLCLGTCDADSRFEQATDGVYLRHVTDAQTPYLISAPGVLREMGGDQTLVVMWVDEGFRTAAIGDADGSWAAVLDRSRNAGADRVKAATEILDFNGWDVSQLRVMK